MKWVLLMLLAIPSSAQISGLPDTNSGDLTLGGVPQLIANKIAETKPCGLVDLSGHIGGGAYLPLYTFHDMSGKNYFEAMDIGYRAIQGSAPSVMLMPVAFNVTGISDRLWNFQWAHDHLTRSKFPDVFVGITAIIPLGANNVNRLTLNGWRNWTGAVASVRFK